MIQCMWKKVVALLMATAASRAADLPTGQIVDSVECALDNTQHYALYLPSNYTPSRQWSVIIAFDGRRAFRFDFSICELVFPSLLLRSFRKPGDPGGTTYRAGRSFSSPLLPHRCYASRKSLEFRSRGPWPPVGGTDSHACKVTRRLRVYEKTKREMTAITEERAAEEDGNAISFQRFVRYTAKSITNEMVRRLPSAPSLGHNADFSVRKDLPSFRFAR
jgi:hypothetical protein